MRFGLFYALISCLLTVTAVSHGNWWLLVLWPATSFAVVSSAYLKLSPRVLGKRSTGRIAFGHRIVLLPYLTLVLVTWRCVRLIRRGRPWDQLTETILIGRRLLSREVPDGIDHVLDLTCEFDESRRLRQLSYHSFPILDGGVPTIPQLSAWVDQAARLSGTIYIHCAEGLGRTALFAAALLLRLGIADSATDAVKLVRARRPAIRLSSAQSTMLAAYAKSLADPDLPH